MLKTLTPILIGVVTVAVFSGPVISSENATPSRPCAFVREIDNFKRIDDRSVIIETSPSRRFKVTFFNTCRELKWAWSIRIEARPGICLTPGDVLVVGRDRFPERCMVQTVEALPSTIQQTPASY